MDIGQADLPLVMLDDEVYMGRIGTRWIHDMFRCRDDSVLMKLRRSMNSYQS